VAIATFEEADWAALTAVLELDSCQADERFSSCGSRWANREELDRIIADATRSRNAFRLAHLLQDAGVAATPVRTAADLLEDDQLLAEGFMETVVHSELGAAMLPKLPWRLSTVDNARRPTGAAPDFGEGTRELLQGILGLEDSTWEDLRSRGVVG
jgi:crotonobetainyl-CoA:carnitine CoA-transferase CaiB-like acyl-CoA transferase